MSFVIYDLTFLAIFTIAIVWFLIAKRKNLEREGIVFLYKTKIGLKVIDYLGTKHKKVLKILSYVIVVSGYVLMATMIYLLINLIFIFSQRDLVQIIKVPPLMPLIPYLPSLFKIEWLPPLYFTYWIIILAVVAIVHEGAHGIYSRYNKIKVKSTGFGFLGPLLAFFVEPDEKQMKKSKIFPQLTILGAGVFANIIASIFFFLIMWLFFSMAYTPAGALFNTYSFSMVPVAGLSNITIENEQLQIDGINATQVMINGKSYFMWDGHIELLEEYEEGYMKVYQDLPAVREKMKGAIIQINDKKIMSHDDIREEIRKHKIGDEISVTTKDDDEILNYDIVLGESYDEEGVPVIGVGVLISESSGIRGIMLKMMNAFRDPSLKYEPKGGSDFIEFIYFLLWWIVLINIGVALFNILPIGITDGGRFWYLSVLGITKSEKIAGISYKIVTWIILAIFALLMVYWGIGII